MTVARAGRATNMRVLMGGRYLSGRCSAGSAEAVFGATAGDLDQDHGIASAVGAPCKAPHDSTAGYLG